MAIFDGESGLISEIHLYCASPQSADAARPELVMFDHALFGYSMAAPDVPRPRPAE
jgi:hypothetical protein